MAALSHIFLIEGLTTLTTTRSEYIMATKTESVAIKVTPEEKEKIKKLAEAADQTVSKYLYKVIQEVLKDE
jgi:uncharacterized protein (DUF1778 family)